MATHNGGDINFESEQARLVGLAMQLVERRGTEVTRAMLAADTQMARARIDRFFPEESDLFDAVVERWFQPLVAIMEDVLASNLPPNRKMYEFIARRFVHQRDLYHANAASFALYCELGRSRMEDIRSYVDLADHYLAEIIAQAQAEDYFPGLTIDQTLSLINQMVVGYTQPDVMIMMDERLSEQKLARIIDTLFTGLSAKDGGAAGVRMISAV